MYHLLIYGGLKLLAVFLILIAASNDIVHAQALVSLNGPPMVFAYHDSQGQGRLTLADLGPDEATGGRQVKISLSQNDLSYYGSGITRQLEATMPFTTLISFTLVSARTNVSFHFQGTLVSGIVVSGSGTYHRAGAPERKAKWSIVLGGSAIPAGPSAIRGQAVAGPIFPVERPGVPNTRPLPGAIITVQPAGGGPEITRVRADQDGRFQIPIAPGTYLIVPLPPDPTALLPRAEPQTVTVKAGGFADIVIEYNTGIR